jgi:hypothetical protein
MKLIIPWSLIILVFIIAWLMRIEYIEPQALSIVCESGVVDWPCLMRKNLMAIFYDNAVGYLVLGLGLLALVLRSGVIGLLCAVIGMTALVIHGGKHTGVEYSSLGFVVGFLTLARAQFQKCRN